MPVSRRAQTTARPAPLVRHNPVRVVSRVAGPKLAKLSAAEQSKYVKELEVSSV